MTDLTRASAHDLGRLMADGQASAVEVTTAHLDRIAAVDDRLGAFLTVDTEGALAQAKAIDDRRAAGEKLGPLAGVPLAVKDVFTTKGLTTTCASRILEGWVPPYDATVVARARTAGMVVVGKTNMDEFAMGSSTENSAYQVTRNPWDLTRIPGGSSGGSSAAVSGFLAPLALGTDTGGSIRQPAAVTGIVGAKPTYGGASRYGLIAFSSSLDQAGPMARTVVDAALLHEAIGGYDPMDSTSIDAPVPAVVEAARSGDVRGMRIGVVKELGGDGYEAGVLAGFAAALEDLAAEGAEIVEVSCPTFSYALPAYYLIAPSEASSNLARFDAMRYGLRIGDDGHHSAEEVMAATRAAGFGPEVTRRILLGTYALSSGYYDAFYGQAQKVRTLIIRDFEAAYTQADVLLSPSTPTVAFPLGARVDDPIAMYAADLATIPSNLAGGASMSVPVSLSESLPVGVQVMAPPLADDRMYRVAAAIERAQIARDGHLLIEGAPTL